MKRMKKVLMLVVGLAAFLCTVPAFAEEATIIIPYAVDEGAGGDWWSGLAISNTSYHPIDVEIQSAYGRWSTELKRWMYDMDVVEKITIYKYSTVTKPLREFFTKKPYPGYNEGSSHGRSMLILKGTGDRAKYLRATLFTGSTDPSNVGFGYQVFEPKD